MFFLVYIYSTTFSNYTYVDEIYLVPISCKTRTMTKSYSNHQVKLSPFERFTDRRTGSSIVSTSLRNRGRIIIRKDERSIGK